MSEALVAGLFGLSGAVIGAGATAWVSLAQQRRDAEAERHRREEEAARDLLVREEARRQTAREAEEAARIAARLLQADTLQARLRVSRALNQDRYWSEPFALPLDSWFAYREQVARYLPLEGWGLVSRWYRSASSVEAQAMAARSFHNGERRPKVTTSGRRQLELALKRADRALAVLEAFTADTAQAIDEAEFDDETDASPPELS